MGEIKTELTIFQYLTVTNWITAFVTARNAICMTWATYIKMVKAYLQESN